MALTSRFAFAIDYSCTPLRCAWLEKGVSVLVLRCQQNISRNLVHKLATSLASEDKNVRYAIHGLPNLLPDVELTLAVEYGLQSDAAHPVC